MANKQKHKYSLGFNTRDQIKALAGSAKTRIATEKDINFQECQTLVSSTIKAMVHDFEVKNFLDT